MFQHRLKFMGGLSFSSEKGRGTMGAEKMRGAGYWEERREEVVIGM